MDHVVQAGGKIDRIRLREIGIQQGNGQAFEEMQLAAPLQDQEVADQPTSADE